MLLSLRSPSVLRLPRQQSNKCARMRNVGSIAGVSAINSTQDGLSRRDRWRLLKSAERTHVLTIPMYQNPAVWTRLEEFREALRKDCAETGLESDIIVPWINDALEFRVGNINIKDGPAHRNDDTTLNRPSFEHTQVNDLLQSLKAPIRRLIHQNTQDGVLRVPLGRIRPLSGDQFHPQKVNVLLLEPNECKEKETLMSISRIAFEAFKNAGILLAPPVMPPGLTTTLINTKNRERHKSLSAAERTKKDKRVPFNLEALYASESFKTFLTGSLTENPSDLQEPISVTIGRADITCLCLRRVAMPFETRELMHDGKIDFAD